MKKLFLLAPTIFCFLNLINAQAGQLDPSFGNHGIVKTSLGTYGASPATRLLLQPDGSMYIVQGSSISKRLSDGSADLSFGLNGTINEAGFSVNTAAIQSDGKILAAGSAIVNGVSNFAVARYNTNGSPDSSFSGDGKQTIHISSINTGDERSTWEDANLITIQKDGKIIIAGLSSLDLFLIRYNTDGSLDSTFSNDGLLESLNYYFEHNGWSRPTVLTIQSDGKIVVGGGSKTIVRYNTDGSLDESFSIFRTIRIYSLAAQSDGKMVAAADTGFYYPEDRTTEHIPVITRFNIDGSLDKSFSHNGILSTAFTGKSLAVQNDEKIVVAYTIYDHYGSIDSFLHINRYNPDGSLDKSFSDDGKQTTHFNSDPNGAANPVVIQPDGKIVVGGGEQSHYDENNNKISGYFALLRYNTDGSLDNTFGKDGKLTDSTHLGKAFYKKIVVQKDGKIVTAGSIFNGTTDEMVIARYNTDGSLDDTFSNDGIELSPSASNYSLTSLVIQKDEKIIAAGGSAITRYNTNGSTDTTFASNVKEVIYSVAVQNDGKILIGGSDSHRTFTIARYTNNGSIDKTFGTDGKLTLIFSDETGGFKYSEATSIGIQSDGKIVVGGVAFNAQRDPQDLRGFIALVRLNSNGSLDNTFSEDGKSGFHLDRPTSCSLVIQNDGRIVIGGGFSDFITQSEGISFKRFNTDGSIDTSFKNIGFSQTAVRNQITLIAQQSDGKIVVSSDSLLRYNSNGNLDSTFNINAAKEIDFTINDIAIAGNKLYVVGDDSSFKVARYLLDNSNNTAPTVTLTTPADNTIRLAPAGHIRLRAVASDKDGTISKVEFYNGTKLLHTETVFPYGYVWEHVPLGHYTLTAKAYDNSGLVTTSAPVHISVVPNKPPVVSIIKPNNNQRFTAPGYIHLEAAASDTDGRVTNVRFYNGSDLLRTEYEYPYTYHWENVPAGTYTITAVATDNWGAHTTSAPVTIEVKSVNTMVVSSKPMNNRTGISSEISLKLSPNPATNVVNIYTDGLQQNKPATISIISASGIVLKKVQSSSSAKTQLDVSSLASGVYTIEIVSGDKVMYKQFVKL